MDIWHILTIIMAVATAGSLILACFAYFRPRKRQKLLYQTSGIQYFEKDDYSLPSDAVMTFRGQEVARLAKTLIILWNGGTDVLRGEDIVQNDPIRISLPEGSTILSYSTIGETNIGNRVSTDIRVNYENELVVAYEYFNPNDGLIIQVLHDAKQRDPIVSGSAKGLSEGPRGLGSIVLNDFENPRRRRRRRILRRLMLLIGLLMVSWGVLLAVSSVVGNQTWLPTNTIWLFSEEKDVYLAILIIVAGLLYMAIPSYEYWTNRRRYPKPLGKLLQTQDE